MSLQKPLGSSHHDVKFRWNKLITVMDIPLTGVMLRDRNLCIAEHLASRIANQLSDKLKTARASVDHFAPLTGIVETRTTLGWRCTSPDQSFSDQVRSASLMSGRVNRENGNQWCLSVAWIRAVKGCILCSKDYLTRQRHSRDQNESTIER